jgi:hypothetical protein
LIVGLGIAIINPPKPIPSLTALPSRITTRCSSIVTLLVKDLPFAKQPFSIRFDHFIPMKAAPGR